MGGDVEWEPNEEGEDLKQPLPFKAKSELTSCKLYQVVPSSSPGRRATVRNAVISAVPVADNVAARLLQYVPQITSLHADDC